MRKLWFIVLLGSVLCVPASTPSYWFSGFQTKPDAKQAQAYFFLEGTNIFFTYTNNRVIINSSGGGGGGTNAGPQGPQGPQGIAGTNGTNGSNGTNGAAGINGTNGTNGANGSNGVNGTNGAPGINGTNGLPGLNGTNGVSGTNGLAGLNGTNGLAGINGTNGANGTNGTNGATGPQGPAGTNAAVGLVTNYFTTNLNPTITLSGDATGNGSNSIVVTVTNLQQALITNKVYWTNVVSLTNPQSQTVDMNIKEGDFQTSAAFAFLGITHKSTSNYQSVVVTVFNPTASAVPITAPPNTYTNGVMPYNVTNISKVLIEYHPLYNYTNMLVYPLF